MHTLRNKTALVTGAGSGIGRAIALALAKEGAHLLLADINAVAVDETAAQARASGGQASTWVGDLANKEQLDSLAREARSASGGVDVLVNNAGIAWYGPTTKMPDDEWERLMAINLESPIRLTRHLLKTLLARPESHVINMASIAGWVCGGRFSAYHVSKFGLVGFSEALRAEFNRHGLGVTAVCPGPVVTNLYKSARCGYSDRETPQPPAWLCTTPKRVAQATIRSIYRNRAVTVVGAAGHLLYYSKRLAPSLFYAMHGIGQAKNMRRKRAATGAAISTQQGPHRRSFEPNGQRSAGLSAVDKSSRPAA